MNTTLIDNHKYNTLESLLDKSGDFNTAISKNEKFKTLNIYKYILENTTELNVFDGIKINHRFYYLLDNMKVQYCKKCNKPYIYFKKSQKRFSLCNHKQNYDHDHNSSVIRSTIDKKRQNFRDKFSISDEHILNPIEYEKTLDELYLKRKNYPFSVIVEKYTDFYHDLLLNTYNILPIDFNDLRVVERLYLQKNKLTSVPLCKYCNSAVLFIDRIHGYAANCRKCTVNRVKENWKNKIYLHVMNNIDTEKYEVLDVPVNVNRQPLTIRCKSCNRVSLCYINNGALKNINKMHLCKHCEYKKDWKETEVYEYVSTIYDGTVLHGKGTRSIIRPYEIDIYLPDLKVGIEFDGLYHHSDVSKNRHYHLDKTKLCEDNDIQLIHIFEDEWSCKQKIVKSRLKHLICKDQRRVFARDCTVREIDNSTKDKFLKKYHIQGKDISKIRYGLFYRQHLVAVMTFMKSRFNKNYEWELSRYATVSNFCIIGGAGKLLKHFEKTVMPKSLITYADRRWSKGNLYYRLSFSLLHETTPNYFYIKNGIRHSRMLFQKHKLKDVLDVFDESLSEMENMRANGYSRIFDCGNLVFVKNY